MLSQAYISDCKLICDDRYLITEIISLDSTAETKVNNFIRHTVLDNKHDNIGEFEIDAKRSPLCTSTTLV